MNNDLILGWLLGLLGSLVSGIVLFWLQDRRDVKNEALRQRREDTRTARNWASDGKKASLRDFDLQGANLSDKDLSGSDLERSNLERAGLWATNLSGANLRNTNFREANFKGADLHEAKLIGADFTGATIVETDFSGAVLRRTKLSRVKVIENCVWKSVKIDETTELGPELKHEIERQAAANKESQLETAATAIAQSVHVETESEYKLG